MAPSGFAVRSAGDQTLIHTRQHYDEVQSQVFFDELALPEPDRYLGVGSGSHPAQMARLLRVFEAELVAVGPCRFVVYGDVNLTHAANLAAKKLCFPGTHVKAGSAASIGQ